MTDLVSKALTFAFEAHRGQTRKYDKTEYIQHPIRVAMRVARVDDIGQHSIAAALMHDVLEDCPVSKQTIVEKFGRSVADIVDELTDKHTKEAQPGLNRAARKTLEHARLGQVSWEAKTIKLADLADNLRDIDSLDGFAPVFCDEAIHLLGLLRDGDEALQLEVEEAVAALRRSFKVAGGF